MCADTKSMYAVECLTIKGIIASARVELKSYVLD
jgi:hypothetical protein